MANEEQSEKIDPLAEKLAGKDNTTHDPEISGVNLDEMKEQDIARLAAARGNGGPGAAGATVQGPILHAASEAGQKPLPHPEGSTEAATAAAPEAEPEQEKEPAQEKEAAA